MIHAFLLNLFLAIVYLALTGQSSFIDFAIGFLVGYGVLLVYERSRGNVTYAGKVLKLSKFLCYFMYILVKANLQIAYEIITPGMSQTPRIIRYPVAHLSEVELTTLANCITLTPGTLVVDVSDDNKWLYIHCMYARNEQDAIAELDELADHLRREVFS